MKYLEIKSNKSNYINVIPKREIKTYLVEYIQKMYYDESITISFSNFTDEQYKELTQKQYEEIRNLVSNLNFNKEISE